MSVCQNQQTFNDAVYEAVKDYDRKEEKKMRMSGALTFYFILHFIFLFLGVMYALESAPKDHRVLHLTMAIVFSPAYVVAHWLS